MIDNKSVQRALKARNYYAGLIDGDFGPASQRGVRGWALNTLGGEANAWPAERLRIAFEQQMLKDLKFYTSKVDGLAGPATQIAVERWQDYITFDRKSPAPSAGVPAANKWPRQADALSFYGKPGTNHATFTPPYDVFYGGKKVKKITLNAKCVESGEEILVDVLDHYGADEIKRLRLDDYGGSYNNRPMRNGTRLSTHAFAAAWDWNAADNQLRQDHRTARFAHPDYKGWFAAHDKQGWLSLGPARDMDWMHNQAVRL